MRHFITSYIITGFRRWSRRLILFFSVILVILLSGDFIWYLIARSELADARASATAIGLKNGAPTPFLADCSETENALPRYQEAYSLLTRDLPLMDSLQNAPEKWTPEEAAASLAQLETGEYQRAWRLINDGSRCTKICFEKNGHGNPCNLDSVHKQMRTLTELGSLRARLFASLAKPQAAADQFADLLWMHRLFRHFTPGLEMQSWLSNSESRVLSDLRQALSDGQLSGADLFRCRLALDDNKRSMAWKRALQDELSILPLVGSFEWREMRDDLSSRRYQHVRYSPIDISWSLYFSWPFAPIRATDEAAYTRILTDLYVNKKPESPTNSLLPVTNMLFLTYNWEYSEQIAYSRLIAAATIALCIGDGDMPTDHPDVSISRDESGFFTITPKKLTRVGFKNLTIPWRVPMRNQRQPQKWKNIQGDDSQ